MPKVKPLPEGMILRGRTYWADFRHDGQRVRKSLSKNRQVAEDLLIDLRARLQRGDAGMLDNNYSVAELKEAYLKHCRQTLKPKTVQR